MSCWLHECFNVHTSPTGPALPGLPAVLQAARIRSTTSSTPFPSLTDVKTVGPSPRMSLASRSMTASDAPTYGARSIYVAAFGLRLANHQTRAQHSIFHTLLITSKSDCEIPGPPLRGILSPPYKRGRIPSAPSASGVALSSVWLYAPIYVPRRR